MQLNSNHAASSGSQAFGASGVTKTSANGFSPEVSASLLDMWRVITKRKWSILSLAVLLAVVAVAITLAMTPMYKATATLLIESSRAKVVSVEEVYSGVSQTREHFQTQAEILKSRDVAQRVVKDLQLWQQPDYDPRIVDDSWLTQLKAMVGLKPAEVIWTQELLEDSAIKAFQANLSVEPVRLSQIIKVSFVSANPQVAAQVANAVAKAYIASDRDARFRITQEASSYLEAKLSDLKRNVALSESALLAYRERFGLVKLGGATDAIAQQEMNSLTARLTEAQVRRAETESAYRQIRDGGKNYESVPAVARHPQVLDSQNRETAAELKVSQLSQRYGYEHPQMVQATAELQAAKQNTQRQMAAVASSLQREYEQAVATVKTLESSLAGQRTAIASANRAGPQLASLEREVQSNRQIYEMFMQRAKETNLTEGVQNAVARVIDEAVPPLSPFKPQKVQIVAITWVLGLFLGALMALLLDRLDNTIKSTADGESKLGLPALASLPILNGSDRKAIMSLLTSKSDSQYAEAIRTARASLMLSNVDNPRKIFLVTSALAGEGKSSLAANLALAHAQTKSTLLIDADMRRPQIARNFNLKPGAHGLSNVVSGECAMSEAIHELPDSSLSVMPCGAVPPNPTELLLSQRFSDTLQELSKRYEVIIIDSPPVELVSDAMVLSALVTNTLFVVRAMHTPYQIARKGITKLQRSGARIIGTVLTGVDFKNAQKYYGDYSGYGHYGSDNTGYYKASKT